MRSGKHLTLSERCVIKFLLDRNFKKIEIANEIGVAKSTITYELKMNSLSNGSYDAHQAQEMYKARRKNCVKKGKLRQDRDLYIYVIEGLRKFWSPEQISGRLSKYYRTYRKYISKDSIYNNIYNGSIGTSFIQFLRQSQPKRRKNNKRSSKKVIIKDKKNMNDRPKAVDNKSRYGDWEGDTIFGKDHNGYLATFVERKSSYLAAALMQNKEAKTLNQAASCAFGDIENKYLKTITVDNGTEFAEFENLETLLETKVYFADPYSPWQRGLSENTNGLIRQFFPKKTNFKNVNEEELERSIDLLNHRPRKKLGYLAPYEVFIEKKKVRLATRI
jgi:transposase, IS30 family